MIPTLALLQYQYHWSVAAAGIVGNYSRSQCFSDVLTTDNPSIMFSVVQFLLFRVWSPINSWLRCKYSMMDQSKHSLLRSSIYSAVIKVATGDLLTVVFDSCGSEWFTFYSRMTWAPCTFQSKRPRYWRLLSGEFFGRFLLPSWLRKTKKQKH